MPLNKKEKKMRRCSVVLENTCTGGRRKYSQEPQHNNCRVVISSGCIDVSPCRALCQQKAISYTTEAVFVDGSGLPHSWDERHR